MSIFCEAFVWCNGLLDGVWVPWAQQVWDEFAAALVMLPFAFSNVRWPISDEIACTDGASRPLEVAAGALRQLGSVPV